MTLRTGTGTPEPLWAWIILGPFNQIPVDWFKPLRWEPTCLGLFLEPDRVACKLLEVLNQGVQEWCLCQKKKIKSWFARIFPVEIEWLCGLHGFGPKSHVACWKIPSLENPWFVDDCPSNKHLFCGYPIATFDYQSIFGPILRGSFHPLARQKQWYLRKDH